MISMNALNEVIKFLAKILFKVITNQRITGDELNKLEDIGCWGAEAD